MYSASTWLKLNPNHPCEISKDWVAKSFHRGLKAGYTQKVKNQNGIRIPNSNTGSQKTIEHCLQNLRLNYFHPRILYSVKLLTLKWETQGTPKIGVVLIC